MYVYKTNLYAYQEKNSAIGTDETFAIYISVCDFGKRNQNII